MMRRIELLTVLVSDYDAGIEFFRSVLDFELLEVTALTETKRWVRVAPSGADTGLLLAVADTEAQQVHIGIRQLVGSWVSSRPPTLLRTTPVFRRGA